VKLALVHDWLTNFAGGEQVLLALHQLYQDAPIYTSVYDPDKVPQFQGADVRTSFLQNLPLAKRKHQLFPTLRTLAFESFDFSEYDVVISSDSAEAKGILTRPETTHICYCHTPGRYYWSHYAEYLKNPGYGWLNPLVRLAMPRQVAKMQQWDYVAAQRVDYFIANSKYVAKRIKKYYQRPAEVIYPPVDIAKFPLASGRRKGYLVVGRQVPYKRVDLAIAACNQLKRDLVVVGQGSEHRHLKNLAGPTIQFVTDASDADLATCYGQARALLFPGEEDFGIVPVEAMATGTPVIAFNKGGVKESIGQSGVLFNQQSVSSLVKAIKKFESQTFTPAKIRSQIEHFNTERFKTEISQFVSQKVAK
jgi:glycosyltransferase involved in cell wall biosynthesis